MLLETLLKVAELMHFDGREMEKGTDYREANALKRRAWTFSDVIRTVPSLKLNREQKEGSL
jgi:hypothetical protein